MYNRLLNGGREISWVLLLALLPISSMPLIKDLVGSTAVASPSLLPLAALLVLWLIPLILRGGKLPGQSSPLFFFALAAVISSAGAFFLALPAFKEQSVLRNEIEAFITLGLGFGYYLTAATFVRDEARLKLSLRVINWSGLVILVWSLMQAAAWFGTGHYPEWLREAHNWFSLGLLYRQRVTGLAIEPSWLAHQLNMLYLPLWLGASVTRSSAHPVRVLGLSVENLLLAGGAVTLGLSLSRVGLGAFLLVLSFLFLRGNAWLIGRIKAWWQGRSRAGVGNTATGSRGLTVLLAGVLAVIYLGILAGGLFAFSRIDPRMEDVFRTSSLRNGGFLSYANQLQFGERAVYWQAGWEVFDRYPALGVGLGNAGFFFNQTLPAYGWNMIEVRRLMFREYNLPNTKNLWVRLLAETGVVGFALFAAWLYLIWESTRWLRSRSSATLRACGFGGMFVLLALLLEGFSIDSFALPYWWVSTGLVTAAASMAARESESVRAVQPVGGIS